MPSTATITAFFVFSANTKARATQVNANNDVFRGHQLPLNVATATAAHNTWDIGSPEYFFRKGYIGELNLGQTTGSWKIADETSTAGDLVFYKNGVERKRFSQSFSAFGSTLSASAGQFAVSATLNVARTTSPKDTILELTGASIDIITTGGPVEIGFFTSFSSTFSTNSPGLALLTNQEFMFCRNTTTAVVGGINNSYTDTQKYNDMKIIDFPAAGTYTYKIAVLSDTITGSINLRYCKLYAYEIRG